MAAYDEEGISRFSWYGVVASIQKISCLEKFFGPKSHLKADMDGAETAFTDAQDPVRCLMMRICVVSIELCRLTHCRAIVDFTAFR